MAIGRTVVACYPPNPVSDKGAGGWEFKAQYSKRGLVHELKPLACRRVLQVFDLRRSVTEFYQDIGNTFGPSLMGATTRFHPGSGTSRCATWTIAITGFPKSGSATGA